MPSNEESAAQVLLRLIKMASGEEKKLRKRKARVTPNWEITPKKCPKCGKTKLVVPDFGLRHLRGNEYAQPWCNNCRAGTNYHARARKNKTVNNP